MLFLILLPLIPVVWWLATHSLGDTLIDICLPIMVLVPMFYSLQFSHLMGFNAHDVVLLPVAAVTLARYGQNWRLHRCDLWIFMFVLGAAYAQGRTGVTLGIRAFFETGVAVCVPYVLGRLLMEEEGIRERFLRRLCWLLAFVAVVSLVEFTLGKNLFTIPFAKLFSIAQRNPEQLRGGFTRAQGPFGHAIVAGIMYASGWIFALWLSYMDRLRLGSGERKFLGIRRSRVLVGVLFMGLLIAYSRGPWIGATLSLGIWLIARSKNVARTTVFVVVIGAIAGVALYLYLNAYTSGSPQSMEQQNAIYRRQLLQVYSAIAAGGGIFGWGLDFPRVAYETSIDNQYLYLRLVGGLVGLWTFNLIAFESCFALIVKARRATQKPEFSFCLTLLAVLGGMLLTLASVSLDLGARELFFLCVGWSLALQPARTRTAPAQPQAEEPFRFQRIIA